MPVDLGFEQVERKLERGATPFIQKAHERALYWLQHRSVNPEKLTPPFDPEMVKRDMATAKRLEIKFKQVETAEKREEKMIATVFEVALWWLTRQKEFLGDKTKAVLPSRFDDYVNGTDLILEIIGENEQIAHLGLGIDATFGTVAVRNKLMELTGKVSAGNMSEIRYFVSSDGKYKGSLSGVPHAVVGLSVARARDVARLWRLAESGEKLPVEPKAHPLRALILHQLVAQTTALAVLARSRGNEELANQYEAVYRRLTPIYETAYRMVGEKEWIDSASGEDYRKDPIHMEIIEQSTQWLKAGTQRK